jgi:hypothetical protein
VMLCITCLKKKCFTLDILFGVIYDYVLCAITDYNYEVKTFYHEILVKL